MFIDTHCHLHDRGFFTAKQAEAAILRAKKANVKQLICIGTTAEDSLATQKFASQHPGVFCTFGVHPESAAEYFKDIAHQKALAEKAFSATAIIAPIAIGEVGLDYHYQPYDRTAQIKLLEQMIQLAIDHQLPLSFHVREAFDDFFAVVDNFSKITGVVHSFSDSPDNLQKALSRGFYIGINGLTTFANLPIPPLDRALLETDAPFLTPVPNRGKINEPAYVPDIAQYLSTKTGVSVAKIAEITTENARQLFNLPDTILCHAQSS